MLDIESFCDRFKLGDIEDIFIMIYSYFIIGFLILFTTYEQKFLALELHIQILLSIAISLPVTSITAIIGYIPKIIIEIVEENVEEENVEEDVEEENVEEENVEGDRKGLFYETVGISFVTSIFYSIAFSLFYMIKHLEVIKYDNKFDPVIAVTIIFLILSILCIRLVRVWRKNMSK